MRLFRTAASLLLVAMALTACGGRSARAPEVKELPTIPAAGGELSKPGQAPASSQAPPSSSQPAPATTPNPVSPAPAGTATADQASQLLQKGDVNGAIAILVQVIASQPTADNYNLLCYAYLQAGRYQEAYDAGKKAVTLDGKLAVALYNTGAAALQLGRVDEAQGYLQQSIAIAPDRYESHIELAMAYGMSGRYVLAKYEVDQAERVSPGQATTQTVRAKVSDMLDAFPPLHLATERISRLEDGTTTLSLHGDSKQGFTAYAATGQRNSAVPLGAVPFDKGHQFTAVTLPGGVRGYLLSGPDTQAFAAKASEWRLFAMIDGKLRQFIFLDPQKLEHYQRQASDFARSGGPPTVQGSNLVAVHYDDMSGQQKITLTYRLDMNALTATLTTAQ